MMINVVPAAGSLPYTACARAGNLAYDMHYSSRTKRLSLALQYPESLASLPWLPQDILAEVTIHVALHIPGPDSFFLARSAQMWGPMSSIASAGRPNPSGHSSPAGRTPVQSGDAHSKRPSLTALAPHFPRSCLVSSSGHTLSLEIFALYSFLRFPRRGGSHRVPDLFAGVPTCRSGERNFVGVQCAILQHMSPYAVSPLRAIVGQFKDQITRVQKRLPSDLQRCLPRTEWRGLMPWVPRKVSLSLCVPY